MADGTITSEMEGTEEFEGMSPEELESELPRQGEAPKGEATEGRAQRQGAGSEGAGKSAGTEKAEGKGDGGAALNAQPGDSLKNILDKMSALETVIQNMNRESLAYRALQSRLDKLESAAKQKASSQTAQSPEAEAAAAEQEAADRFIRERAREENQLGLVEFEKKYSYILEPMKRQQLHGNLQKACADAGLPWDEMDAIIGKVITEDDKAAKAGDQAAIARVTKLLETRDISDVMYRALLERSKSIQAQGATVKKEQAKAADKGGRMVNTNGQRQSPQAKNKRLEDMSPEEVEDLANNDLDALGKLLPAQSRR